MDDEAIVSDIETANRCTSFLLHFSHLAYSVITVCIFGVQLISSDLFYNDSGLNVKNIECMVKLKNIRYKAYFCGRSWGPFSVGSDVNS